MRKTAMINFEEVMDCSKARMNLVPVLENEKNVSEKVYSFDFLEDVKITFRIRFRDGVSVVVTEGMVKAWDCEPWDLVLDAQNNLRPKVMMLEDAIGLPEGDLPIMVLTTEEGIRGGCGDPEEGDARKAVRGSGRR